MPVGTRIMVKLLLFLYQCVRTARGEQIYMCELTRPKYVWETRGTLLLAVTFTCTYKAYVAFVHVRLVASITWRHDRTFCFNNNYLSAKSNEPNTSAFCLMLSEK